MFVWYANNLCSTITRQHKISLALSDVMNNLYVLSMNFQLILVGIQIHQQIQSHTINKLVVIVPRHYRYSHWWLTKRKCRVVTSYLFLCCSVSNRSLRLISPYVIIDVKSFFNIFVLYLETIPSGIKTYTVIRQFGKSLHWNTSTGNKGSHYGSKLLRLQLQTFPLYELRFLAHLYLKFRL